jgi:hypothetical protein
LSAWTIPAGDQEATAWTRDIQLDYQRKVLASYVSGFATGTERPIPVFIRNNLSPELAAPYVAEFAAGHLNWFHTSSEIEPRGASVAKQYETFLSYSRAGQTLGYAEQWAGAWGDHGGKVDPRWYPPPAWNYWRLLSDLNMGVSYIGVYSDDLQVALDGFHRGENAGEEYRRQFDAAFRFAAKYAGHHSDPEHSPGAWVAFRESDTDLKPSLYNNNVTDYTMHMILLNPQDTDGLDARKDGIAAPLVQKQTIKGLYSIGPYYQRFGAWARKLPAGNTMQLKLDEKFARSLDGSKAAINVTYYDHAEGTSFTLQSSGVSQTIALSGTGKWMKASVPVNQAAFANNGSVALITVSSIGSDVIFHMVEVTRDAE